MKRIEGVTERLLAAAREEFLEKGYEAASLRAIAERAGSSKGAIYVRYADKEALYAAVVDPVIEELCLFFTEEFDGFGKLPADVQQSTMNDYADQGIGLMMDYIYDHLAEFKILVTNGGERYDEFMHRGVELNSATTDRYIEAVGSDAVTAGRLTPELMHMISSACFSGIFEAVAHDMGRDEAKAYVERLCLFFRAGWQAIFDPQFAALVDLAAQMPDAPVQDVAARLVEARGGAPCGASSTPKAGFAARCAAPRRGRRCVPTRTWSGSPCTARNAIAKRWWIGGRRGRRVDRTRVQRHRTT